MVSWPQGLLTVRISERPDIGWEWEWEWDQNGFPYPFPFPFLVRFLLCLPPMILAPRYLPRIAATIGLFTRYGLADFAKQQGLQGIAPEPGEEGAEGPSAETAAKFRKRLVELGPAYVKLGQVLSTRPDLLPEVYIRELEKLQDDVDPIPYSEVERIVEEELKGRISKMFGEFNREPIGSASLGQVHAATLRDG